MQEQSTATHTPGPWRTGTHWWSQFVYTAQADPVQVANCEGSGVPHAERLANARLMAAAPDLLEACRRARGWLYGSEPEGLPVLEVLEQAIAKATDADH